MAETTTHTINVELTYSDYDTRTYKLPFADFSEEGIIAAKEALRNFNAAAQTAGSVVQQTFISNNGAPVVGINAATLVERKEEVIYNVG